MTQVWAQTAMWLGLALVATLLSIWLKVATALSEIVVGTIAQLVIGVAAGAVLLAADDSGIKFLSGAGAIILTFLAGAELDPQVFRRKWREASAVGLAGFLFPFLGCTAGAHWLLGWESRPSWLAGVAMSTTSVAVVSHGIIDQGRYSVLVAAVIASAVVPTLLANAFYLPHHLLPETAEGDAQPKSVATRMPHKGHD